MLRGWVDVARAKGHEYIQITVNRRNSPKNWDRVSVFPGLYARCVGRVDPGTGRGGYLLDLKVVDVEDWLAKQEAACK